MNSNLLGIDATQTEMIYPPPPDPNNFHRTLGLKDYTGDNHLGNVLVTFTDRKIPNSSGGTWVDYCVPEITACNDYMPFGGLMADRTYNAHSFPNSFNNKRDDVELGDWQDYGERMYSPWMRKFVTPDPLFKKFAFYSTYQFSGNRPIDAIDLDGKEPKSIVSFNPVTTEYSFTKPAIHLLSLVSNVSEERIAQVTLIPKSQEYFLGFRPIASTPAITSWNRITFQNEYFDQKNTITPAGIIPWLSCAAHEVGHLPQSDAFFHNSIGKLAYGVSFLAQYAKNYISNGGNACKAHDDVPREIQADRGEKKLDAFKSFVDKNYGEGRLQELFNSNKSDEQKIKKIDTWWQAFQEQEKSKKNTPTTKKK